MMNSHKEIRNLMFLSCILKYIVDIDECNANDACAHVGNSTCVNNPGSYECVCGNGLIRDGNNCKGKLSNHSVYAHNIIKQLC